MKVEFIGAAIAGLAVFMAQSIPTMPLGVLSQLISALGPMGFVMWLVWRTTNHTIPRLAKQFEDTLDRERADFKAALAEQRVDFMKVIDREREMFTKLLDTVEQRGAL